jgi:hypothetical protein
MTMAQRKKERKELMDDLLTRDWNVFGTLKFENGRTIGRYNADKLLRRYWNKIDLTFFGKAAERQNIRVPRWCFAHEGSDSENLHVHFALLAPVADIKRSCCVLNAVWAQQHNQTAPMAKNWILPVNDRFKVASYLTKEYWRLGNDTFLDHLSWDQSTLEEMAQYEHDQQQARIKRAASPIWLRHAQQALEAQQAAYEADDGNLVSKRG